MMTMQRGPGVARGWTFWLWWSGGSVGGWLICLMAVLAAPLLSSPLNPLFSLGLWPLLILWLSPYVMVSLLHCLVLRRFGAMPWEWMAILPLTWLGALPLILVVHGWRVAGTVAALARVMPAIEGWHTPLTYLLLLVEVVAVGWVAGHLQRRHLRYLAGPMPRWPLLHALLHLLSLLAAYQTFQMITPYDRPDQLMSLSLIALVFSLPLWYSLLVGPALACFIARAEQPV